MILSTEHDFTLFSSIFSGTDSILRITANKKMLEPLIDSLEKRDSREITRNEHIVKYPN